MHREGSAGLSMAWQLRVGVSVGLLLRPWLTMADHGWLVQREERQSASQYLGCTAVGEAQTLGQGQKVVKRIGETFTSILLSKGDLQLNPPTR